MVADGNGKKGAPLGGERRRPAGTHFDVQHLEPPEDLTEVDLRLASILSRIPGVAYRCRNDSHWTMEFISKGCRELTGYSTEDLVGNHVLSFADLIIDTDRTRLWNSVQRSVEQGYPFQLEYRIRTRSGEIKWVWEQGIGVRAAETGDVFLEGIIHDITQRYLWEEQRDETDRQVRAAQRMEAIGRLAGGVAHDFNNILTVIQSNAEFLREQVAPTHSFRDDLEVILDAAQRASRLTSQLLAFSRRQVQELAVVNLNEIVGEVDRMLRRIIGEDIDLVTRLTAQIGLVRVDIGQIEQILMNLAVNARDAMPRGGKLTIETANVELEETYGAAKDANILPGRYVMLAMTDTGVGMSRELQSKIFEPFFTTKDKDKGTGLGLSTVYGIVKQSGGSIWVYSEEGYGTSFKIYLPQVSETTVAERPRQHEAKKLTGSETILLVEDEPAVRKVTARILGRSGYQVIESSNGLEALEICRDSVAPIHLLLTDIVMPHMSGEELGKQAFQHQPKMKIMYMSGYTDNAIAHQGVLDEGTMYLQKPFSAESLLRKVREALGEP